MAEQMQSSFTDSIFYEIELTAKYCKMLGTQIFEKYHIDIPIDEFSVLDTLNCNPEICQRDLAKLIIKDRANTGKLLNSLEKKGLVKRKLSVKNNRPVKVTELTEAGIKKTREISDAIRPHIEVVRKKVQNSDLNKIRGLLKELRDVLNDTVEVKI